MSQLTLDDDIDGSPDKKEGFLGEASGLVYDGATISGSSMVGEVLRIKEILQNNKEESDSKLFELLRRLQLMEATVDLLKATEIGKVVNPLCKHGSKEIRQLARTLVHGWKEMVDERVDATEINKVGEPLRPSNDKVLKDKKHSQKRGDISTWTERSESTEDGSGWSKYDQKDIFGDKFPMQYFSSSHRNNEGSEGSQCFSSDGGAKVLDINRLPAAGAEEADDGTPMSSSPNSVSSFHMDFYMRSGNTGSKSERELDGDGEITNSRASDDDENGSTRKKLRLSKEQSAFLEESFKEHSILNTKQKLLLAKKLNLRPRQVEVWFQNRRARTKLKQTEVDCEYLKRCCETLAEENKRLQKELQELRALKTSQPFYM